MNKIIFSKVNKYKHYYGNGGFYKECWFHWNREFCVSDGDFFYNIELHKGNGNQNFDVRVLKKMIRREIIKKPNLTEDEFEDLIYEICYTK